MTPQVQPLSYSHRNFFFYLLAAIFLASLPFLFLYATGYRFHFGEQTFVSTGGLYVAADRTGAEIYIDNELVRETRVFRRAFYAQGLDAGTHRVHVQKEGHHTWVKELPVYPQLVTEAQAFNLPLAPQIEVISPWQTPAGVELLLSTTTVLKLSSTTNQYLLEPRANLKTMDVNANFADLLSYFTGSSTEKSVVSSIPETIFKREVATSTATTSKEYQGVKLFESDGDVYASFVGDREQMPYYYCAEDFPSYNPSASSTPPLAANVAQAEGLGSDSLDLETQSVPKDANCDPTILIGRGGEKVSYFDFFPNSTDLVLLAEETGIYVVEIDDRSWQNRQPLIMGKNLEARVINGSIYIYDGDYIYHVLINQNWF